MGRPLLMIGRGAQTPTPIFMLSFTFLLSIFLSFNPCKTRGLLRRPSGFSKRNSGRFTTFRIGRITNIKGLTNDASSFRCTAKVNLSSTDEELRVGSLPSTSFQRMRGRSGLFTFTQGGSRRSSSSSIEAASSASSLASSSFSSPSSSSTIGRIHSDISISLPQQIPKSKKSVLDIDAICSRFDDLGIKHIHLSKIWKYAIQNPFSDDNGSIDVPHIPKVANSLLEQEFSLCTSKLVQVERSKNNDTIKFIVELHDGQLIESVIIQHDSYAALCVSSQVGCRMGCRFCATGTMGLIRNLSSGEILEQLQIAQQIKPIRNVVFMGMGEPLDNYLNVLGAIRGIHDTRMFNLGLAHITVSTVGVIDNMYRLADEVPKVALAVSLHAPDQILREKLIPSGKFNSMEDILNAMDYYLERSPHHSFIQYTVIKGVNDREDHARRLAQALKGRRVKINLIPCNPTEKLGFETPSSEAMEVMKRVILEEGILCFIRDSTESGRDVSGACGQLALKTVDKRQKHNQ